MKLDGPLCLQVHVFMAEIDGSGPCVLLDSKKEEFLMLGNTKSH